MDVYELKASRRSRVECSKAKTSPKKRDLALKPKPPDDFVAVSNNSEECGEKKSNKVQQRRQRNVHIEQKKMLAASLLQRQAHVWLLRRQETMKFNEVQRLRGELRDAAACVIRESYTRFIKRRAISNYLYELGKFETRLDALLQGCVVRKRKLEEVQHFATLRRQQKLLEDDRKRKLVHGWLAFCVQTRRKEKEQTTARAHLKILCWVRRWTLRKRCEARIIAREKAEQLQAHHHNNAQIIVTVYRAYKVRCNAKEVVKRRRRICDGVMKFYSTFRLHVQRAAQFRWQARAGELTMAHKAAKVIQGIYHVHQARARFVHTMASCVILQRVLRGHLARVRCSHLKHQKILEVAVRERHAAATEIQRCVRGHQTRFWFRDILLKLRERFRCSNCGAVEPGGTYCKYCGRHRTTFRLLSNVLMLHEKWQLGRSSSSATETIEAGSDGFSSSSALGLPPPKKTTSRSRSASLRMMATASRSKIDVLESITSLPAVLPPRRRRVAAPNRGTFDQFSLHTKNDLELHRRNSISTISERTALRAVALAELQAKMISSAQSNVLGMHISRLRRGSSAVNRSTTNHPKLER